jgi:hypothetical protein
MFWIWIISGVLFFALVTIQIIVLYRPKSWKLELAGEIACFAMLVSLIFVVTSSFVWAIVPLTIGEAHRIFVQHKLLDSILYRLPCKTVEAIVEKKRIYKFIGSLFLREYVVFDTAEGQQIKVYLSASAVERSYISAFNIGDFGTLHYRKGRTHLYYEDFEKFEPVSDDTTN